jgi:predicted nucleotidyltransferase
MLLDPMDSILGTRTKVRLLRALVPLERPVSGREAARLAGVSHIALGSLEELAEAGVLNREETSGQHLYTFDRRHVLAPVLEEVFDEERRFTATVFERLREALEVPGSVEGASIFGSAARGEAGAGSDLDLLVVVGDAQARADVLSVLAEAAPRLGAELGVTLSPVVVTATQLRRQHDDGDPFVNEVRRDARRVLGQTVDEVIRG